MILSVSRRTDIPAFYSEWFMNRIREGYVYVRNPFNYKQISKVNITPDVVDCIVFWSKNPKPLMENLNELNKRGYKYYFQFTITPYDEDIEVNVGNKKEIVNTFIALSQSIGKEKVILRYDPIILTEKYSMNFHRRAFQTLCQRLHDYTEKIIISFLDDYRKISKNMRELKVNEYTTEVMYSIAKDMIQIAKEFGLSIETCAEVIDLEGLGIRHGKCIDGDVIEKIIGYQIIHKEKLDGNREYCGCMKSIDIGQYDSCMHHCLYCYANVNKEKAERNHELHDSKSPILLGSFDDSQVKERKDVKSFLFKSTGKEKDG